MLALAMDTEWEVSQAASLLERLGDGVRIVAAGSPAGNGHVAARCKMAVLVVDLLRDVSEQIKEEMTVMGVFNVTARQASSSTKKRQSYRGGSEEAASPRGREEALECLRLHIRIGRERRRLLSMMEEPAKRQVTAAAAAPPPPPPSSPQLPFIPPLLRSAAEQAAAHEEARELDRLLDLDHLLPQWLLDDVLACGGGGGGGGGTGGGDTMIMA